MARFCASCGLPLSTSPERAGEERRTVTALFADLSNFSRLVATLDTEELLAVIDPVIAALSTIVDRHGGYVEKFAGDALLALFGAPVAHEDDALRAVQAACDMHAYLADTSVHPLSARLRLHVGLSTGPVVARTIGSGARTDYAVLGDAVVLAQRLQSAAGPGQTYVDAVTAALAGEHFAFDRLGPVAVKGRDEPVPVHLLTGRRLHPATAAAAGLIGRDEELAMLVAALGDAASGRTVIRCITGPAGYGKSQLIAQLRQRAGALPSVALVATSIATQPYGALRPLILRALAARIGQASSLTEQLALLDADKSAPASSALTALLLGERPPAESRLEQLVPQAVRRELREAALRWWRDLAARGPLLVTIDNLQWLDAASMDVVAEFARQLPSQPVLVCLAGRTADQPELEGVIRLDLPPLTRPAVQELVTAELGLLPGDRLVSFVHERSGGNPLAARETVRRLARDGWLDRHHGHARLVSGAVTSDVPQSLDALLAARVDSLPAPTVRVATVAAVIGPTVPLDLLIAVTEAGPGAVAAASTELVDAGFVAVEVGGLRFDTPLLRDVLYARLTGRRRREVHARVATALLHHPAGSDAFVAEHLYCAGHFRQALPVLRRLAERTRRLFEQDAAALALTRALECARAADAAAVPELLCELGDVRVECGEYGAAGRLFAEAQALGGGARAWAGQAGALRRSGDYAGALALLDRALQQTLSGDARLVWCELAWSRSVAGDLAGSLAAADRGLALHPADDRTAALLLLQRVRVGTLLARLETADRDAERAIAVLERESDPAGLCTALRLLGDLQHRAGRLDEAVHTLGRGLAAARRAGLVEEEGGCLINLGLVHGERGDHASASEVYARAAVVFEQVGHTAGCAMAYGNRSYELLMSGDPTAARGLATRALALAEEVGNHFTAADIHHTLGLIAETLGELPVARRQAEAAIAEFESAGMPDAAQASRELALRCAGSTL